MVTLHFTTAREPEELRQARHRGNERRRVALRRALHTTIRRLRFQQEQPADHTGQNHAEADRMGEKKEMPLVFVFCYLMCDTTMAQLAQVFCKVDFVENVLSI